MSKTYILEPTEVEFIYNVAVLESESTLDKSIFEDCDGCTIEVSNYPFTVKYAVSQGNTKYFTEDGVAPEGGLPTVWANVDLLEASDGYPEQILLTLASSSLPTENCTLTVSIYTGEDDPEPTPEPTPGGLPGLENKNVVYGSSS